MKTLSLLLCAAAALAAASGLPSTPNISLVRVPNNGIQPQPVLDGGGTLHLLYYAGDPGHGDLFYTKSRDWGITWSRPLRVNSEEGTAIAAGTIRGGQIAVGRNGRIHVAWNGSSIAARSGPLNTESGQRGAPMLYSRLNNDQTAFEPERSLMTRTFGLDGGGTVAADSGGNVFVVWHGKARGAVSGETGRQVWLAKSTDSGKTFSQEQPVWNDPTGACACCGMAMFADANGVVRILYRSATESIHRDIYLLTSRDKGGSFEGRKLDEWQINACPMSSMAFAEGGGKIEGAWETERQVYFEDLGRANGTTISAPANSAAHKHPRLAIAPGGETLMAWTEGAGWGKGGALAWQRYDAGGKPLGERCAASGVPAWSFGAVVATPSGFTVIY